MNRRIATLLAFAQAIEIRAGDDAIDILEPLLKQVRSDAERSYADGRLHTITDLDTSSLKLAAATRIFVDPSKYRDGKRVAPVRIALPFQTVETVNESARDRVRTLDLFASGKPTEWRNRLIWGDKK